jgi:hypothetical protein
MATLPRWYIDFQESVYFAFNGTCPNSRVNDPTLGEFTPEEVKKEVEEIKKCATKEDYFRVSRVWSKHRLDRFQKKALWAVVRDGVRW